MRKMRPRQDLRPIEKGYRFYFQDSYIRCRDLFRADALRLIVNLKKRAGTGKPLVSQIHVPSPTDGDLTIDYCYIPAEKNLNCLVIITSGVHGVEGFTGSAVQRMFMREVFPHLDRKELGILIIHGINPFGFKHQRRVTENNVDLNRNFSLSRKLFSENNRNHGYNRISRFLNPDRRVNGLPLQFVPFMLRALYYRLRLGTNTLVQMILQGQYHLKRGIYFGGHDFEPQKGPLQEILCRMMSPYRKIFIIDLHTGFGRKGGVHLFPNPATDSNVIKHMDCIFSGYKLLDYYDEYYYTINGDFTEFVYTLSGKKKLCIPITFDYGTMDGAILGPVHALFRVIRENQYYNYGVGSRRKALKIRRDFLELFYPSSPEWKEDVLSQSKEMLTLFIKRFTVISSL